MGTKADANSTTSSHPLITSISQKLRRPALLGGVTGSPGPGPGGKVLARPAGLLASNDPLRRLPVDMRRDRLLSLTTNAYFRRYESDLPPIPPVSQCRCMQLTATCLCEGFLRRTNCTCALLLACRPADAEKIKDN